MPQALLAEPRPIAAEGQITLEREDITFHDVAPGRVLVEVTIRNVGEGPSRATYARIDAAPLGAFVPWEPLGVLPVPPLGPGESTVLRGEFDRPRPAPLGPPDRVPPRRALTALGLGDEPPARPALRGPVLPADLLELFGRRNHYWAGNLNIFIGDRAVERHQAKALRIEPGRLNLAMFVVGGRSEDSYRFHLEGPGASWDAALLMPGWDVPLALAPRPEDGIEPGRWVSLDRTRVVLLAFAPPEGCASGDLQVCVTRRSTGESAVVEFSFDPTAAGPGCYVVP